MSFAPVIFDRTRTAPWRARVARSVVRLALAFAAALGVAGFSVHAQAPVPAWQPGDVFVGIGNVEFIGGVTPQITNAGQYVVYDPNGNPVGETLTDGGGQSSSGCAVDANGNLWTTGFWSSKITEFSGTTHAIASIVDASPLTVPSGVTDVSLATGFPAGVESVVFDKSGHMFVGTVDGTNAVIEYTLNATGVGVDPAVPPVTYFPPPDLRGTDWLDLAVDQNTMFYTSESNRINAFTLNGAALPSGVPAHIVIQYLDHVDPVTGPVWLPVANTAFAFRLMPPGDAVRGGFLVATEANVYQIDINGHILRGLSQEPGVSGYFSLDITADARSFWTGTLSSNSSAAASTFYKYHLPTGTKTYGPLSAGSSHFINGMCVMKEYTAGLTQPACPAGSTDPLCSPVPICTSTSTSVDCTVPGAPTFDPAHPLADQTSHEGDTISLQLHAISTSGAPLRYSVSNLPDGLTFNASTGVVSGTLSFSAAHGVPYAVQVTVTDTGNSLSVSGHFIWNVIDVNVPPSLNPIANQTTSHNVPVAFPVSGTDYDSTRAPCDLVSFSVVSVVPTGSTPASPLPTLTAVNVPSEQTDTSCSIVTFHATLVGSSSVDGVYAVTVRASDTKPVPGTDTRTFTWTVVNHPPTITAIAGRSTHAGVSITPFGVAASDPDSDPLTFTDLVGASHTLPPGITITAAGQIAGSPQVVGVYPVTIAVSDGYGGVATTSFTWTITNVAPVFVNPPASELTIPNTPVSIQLAATDADGDPLVFAALGLPPGLSISPSGLISGAPTVEGAFPVTLTVSDPWGGTAIARFTWKVSRNQPPVCDAAVASPSLLWPPNHKFVPISILGVRDPDGDPVTLNITRIIQDEPTLSARGGDDDGEGRGHDDRRAGTEDDRGRGDDNDRAGNGDDHGRGDDDHRSGDGSGNTWIDGIGVGTPQASVRAERAGNGDGRIYEIRFTATDTFGASCSGAVFVGVPHDRDDAPVDSLVRYDSTVSGGPPLSGPGFNIPPTIVTPSVSTLVVGHPTSVSVTATDLNLDPLTFTDLVGSSHTLPPGLAINAQTGVISGAPTTPGTYAVTLTVSDPFGGVATTSFAWTVKPDAPPVARNDAATTREGRAVTIAVLANDSDPDRDPLTVTSVTAPSHGTAVIKTNGSIVYSPAPGYTDTDTFMYIVSDGYGGTATATVTVTIRARDEGDDHDPRPRGNGHREGGNGR